MNPISVVIVDDSAVVRKVLTRELSAVPGITVGAKRKGAGLQVTLTGPRVDAELHRAILDLVERWRQD